MALGTSGHVESAASNQPASCLSSLDPTRQTFVTAVKQRHEIVKLLTAIGIPRPCVRSVTRWG